MAILTTDEKALFTADQLTQLARLSDIRAEEYLTAPEGTNPAEFRARILARYASRSPAFLRTRVNIISFRYGRNMSIDWAPECDYTPQEVEAIIDGLKPGDKPMYRIPEILKEGLSVKQRLSVLESK